MKRKKKGHMKKLLAFILAVSLSVPTALVPKVEVSATGVAEYFIDKMVDIGTRVTCEAVMALSESAAKSGYEEISKTTAFVGEWTTMDAAEVAAVEAVELCEEILTELNELEAKVDANDAEIAEAVAEVQWLEKKTSLSSIKTTDIANQTNSLTGSMEAFENYIQTRIKFSKEEATQEEFNESLLDFLFVLSRFTDATPDPKSFESLGEAVFTNQDVSNEMSTAIDNLIANLITSGVKEETVLSTAMSYAYYYYPFSHQQYDFVMTQVGYQLGMIIEVMLMYNEFLALQYDYLSRYVDFETDKGKILYNNYDGWVESFDDKTVTLMENLVEMFSKEYQVSSDNKLTVYDYMKPEDAQKTVLRSDYLDNSSDEITYYDTYKVMTNTNSDENNVFYINNYGNTIVWFDTVGGTLLNSYDKAIAPVSDGVNEYQMPDSADQMKELFNTNAFALNGGTIRNVLYDFDSNGSAYSLLDSYVTHVSTVGADVKSDGILGNKEAYAEFQMIDVNKPFTSLSEMKSESVVEEDGVGKAIIYTSENAFSQNASVKYNGKSGGDLKLVSGSTVVGADEEKAIESGTEITLQFKVPEECRKFTLECIRTYDVFSAETDRISSEILLNENFAKYLETDSNGYYNLTIHMPYSECTFSLDCSEFEYDEEGRVEVGSYEDLKAVADQIKNNPTIYASKSYVLTNDITIPEDSTLEPIGTEIAPFSGTFDGQGYKIKNLSYNIADGSAGLFSVSEGTIKNLIIDGANISGGTVGTVAAYSAGTIENVTVYNSTIDATEQGGGICGIQNGKKISNCSVDVNTKITGNVKENLEDLAVGGIVGVLSGTVTVEKCVNEANIDFYETTPGIYDNYVGGIVGIAKETSVIDQCVNSGSVKASAAKDKQMLGGICGAAKYDLTIKDCANNGDISAEKTSTEYESYVGGIVGRFLLYKYNTDLSGSALIEDCYSSGKVEVSYGYSGGIISSSRPKDCEVKNCYFDSDEYSGDVKSTTIDSDLDLVTVTNSEGKSTKLFASGEVAYLLNETVTDGTQVWYQNLDNGLTPDTYPTLTSNDKNTVYKNNYSDGYTNTSGEEQSPLKSNEEGAYEVSSYEDLVLMAKMVSAEPEKYASATFTQTAFIDCGTKEWNQEIGTEEIPFTGIYDGNNYYIMSLRPTSAVSGLFGVIGENGVVKNLSVVDFDYENAAETAGGLAGINRGTIDNCGSGINLVSDEKFYRGDEIVPVMSLDSEIKAKKIAGGLVAVNEGTIKNSRNSANVNAETAGGLVGENKGTISNVYQTGDVEGTIAGGIAGTNTGTLQYGYNSTVLKRTTVGGIAGTSDNVNIKNMFYTIDMEKVVFNQTEEDLAVIKKTLSALKSQATADELNQFIAQIDGLIEWVYDAEKNEGYPRLKTDNTVEQLLENLKLVKSEDTTEKTDTAQNNKNTVSTGDYNHILSYAVLLVSALACILLIISRRKNISR